MYALHAKTFMWTSTGFKKGTYLCRTDSLLKPLCCKAFSGNVTPHQQHWAVSIQMQPSNHSMVIGRRRTGLSVMVVMLGSTLDVPAWKPCQEARISGCVKTV